MPAIAVNYTKTKGGVENTGFEPVTFPLDSGTL